MTDTQSRGLIQEGDMVILKKDGYLQSVLAKSKRKYNLEKMWFCLDGAIDQPYGTTFETKGNLLVPVTTEKEEEADNVVDNDEVSGKDNRNLIDMRANQKLSREEIESMRKDGTSGKVIVEQLIENSATFKNKTEFAQQKYIKKKKKKHLNRVTVLKPSTRLLVEMYFNKGPTKICNLRMDSLAQILAYSNVRAGSNVLLVESCCGLLTGAIVERLGGHGMVMQLYSGTEPVWQAVNCYNFSEDVRSVLHKYPLKQLAQVWQKHCGEVPLSRSEGEPSKRVKSVEDEGVLCNAPVGGTSLDEHHVKERVGLGSTGTDNEVMMDVEGHSSHTSSPAEDALICKKNVCVKDSREPEVQIESQLGEDVQNQSLNEEEPVSQDQSASEEAVEANGTLTADSELSETQIRSTTLPDQPQGDNDVLEGQKKQGMKRKQEAENQNKEEERQKKQQERLNKIEESRQILSKGNFDGLIVACRHHPTPILINTISLLARSRPFVIFSPYQQPLLDCYMKLRDKGGVANLRLTETWMRQYQVLPNRTHPQINMSNYSGYLLTGITTTLD